MKLLNYIQYVKDSIDGIQVPVQKSGRWLGK